jgi:hypothetical protein
MAPKGCSHREKDCFNALYTLPSGGTASRWRHRSSVGSSGKSNSPAPTSAFSWPGKRWKISSYSEASHWGVRLNQLVTDITLTIVVGILALNLSTPVAYAQKVQEIRSITIGPWEIEAAYKGDKFDHCAMTRTVEDDVSAHFIRTNDGLSLGLESPNWKLERGNSYPVQMAIGSWTWDTAVAADSRSVSTLILDNKVAERLRMADRMLIKGAGATIRLPLDKSAVAFDRLEACFEKNGRAIETNPFVAPKRQP